MIDEQLFTKFLRKPLKQYILKMQRTLRFNQTFVYTTARMGSSSYKKYFDGGEVWKGRERIVIACLLILRDKLLSDEIDPDDFQEYKEELRLVGGDIVTMADHTSTPKLQAFLITVSQSARKRFNNRHSK